MTTPDGSEPTGIRAIRLFVDVSITDTSSSRLHAT
jgi:hypothetical protein